jgi:hypothetical protein
VVATATLQSKSDCTYWRSFKAIYRLIHLMALNPWFLVDFLAS